MRLPHIREEQPEIIINFRGGRDERSRIRSRSTLFDRNGRRKALDVIHLRLLHLIRIGVSSWYWQQLTLIRIILLEFLVAAWVVLDIFRKVGFADLFLRQKGGKDDLWRKSPAV
jgi:hypothetical protein